MPLSRHAGNIPTVLVGQLDSIQTRRSALVRLRDASVTPFPGASGHLPSPHRDGDMHARPYPLTNQLTIAMPSLRDPNFARRDLPVPWRGRR